jgi:hypothetical protein
MMYEASNHSPFSTLFFNIQPHKWQVSPTTFVLRIFQVSHTIRDKIKSPDMATEDLCLCNTVPSFSAVSYPSMPLYFLPASQTHKTYCYLRVFTLAAFMPETQLHKILSFLVPSLSFILLLERIWLFL